MALRALVDGLTAHTLAEQCIPQTALAALDDNLDPLFGPATDPDRATGTG